jgi:hypothetical protein
MSGPGLALLVALVVTLQTGTSMAAGDATPGRASALERHASRHDISPGDPFKLGPPGFAAIAVCRSDTHVLARMSLSATHIATPGIGPILGLDGTDDLLANMTLLEPLPPDRGDWRNRATRTRPQDVSQPGGGERQ